MEYVMLIALIYNKCILITESDPYVNVLALIMRMMDSGKKNANIAHQCWNVQLSHFLI